MNAALQGMHGPLLTPEQLDRAVGDYLGNGASKEPSLRHFRAYLRDAVRPIEAGEAAAEQRRDSGEKEHWRDRNARTAAEEKVANEWRMLTAAVETRRARTVDGDIWWSRMQHECSSMLQSDVFRYAYKHMGESGHLQESIT